MRVFKVPENRGPFRCGFNNDLCRQCTTRTRNIVLTEDEYEQLPKDTDEAIAAHISRNRLGIARCDTHAFGDYDPDVALLEMQEALASR